MIYYIINLILLLSICYYLYDYYYILEIDLRKDVKTNIRRDNLIDLYNIITNISELSNTKPFILYGTLLGYIRNKDLICYDYDLDFGINNNDYEIFKTHLINYLKDNKDIEIEIKDFMNMKSTKLIHKNTGISADIFTLSLNNYYYNRDVSKLYTKYYLNENCVDMPKNWIDNLQKVLFLGRYTYIPNKPHELLKCYYGTNYMTPDHTCNYDCSKCVKN